MFIFQEEIQGNTRTRTARPSSYIGIDPLEQNREKDYMERKGNHEATKQQKGETMPSEILDPEKFIETSGRAEYCSVKRLKDVVKLKLRTPRMLYTLKVAPLKAEEMIKKLQCEVRET
jgi:hypothetical protein